MRTVLQRVTEAKVEVEGKVVGAIGGGLVVLLGIQTGDTEQDAEYLARKIAGLRIFPDKDGKMNRNIADAGGALLVVSQFTLYGDCRKGMRPSFDSAAKPEVAKYLYEYFVLQLRSRGLRVETGIFQAYMQVSLINNGPITLICESVKLTPVE